MTADPGLIRVVFGAPPPEGRGAYVVAVPGERAPVFQLDLPSAIRGAARIRVARQQLRDRIGADADALALIPLGGADWSRMLVCDRARLATWLADPAVTSRRCRAVLHDYLTLPAVADTVLLRYAGGRLMARLGEDEGFSAPVALAPVLLATLLRETGIRRVGAGRAVPDTVLHAARAAGAEVEIAATADAAMRQADLPGDLRVRAGGASTAPRWPWAAAALALLAFGLWAAGTLIETRKFARAEQDLRARTTLLLRQGLIPEGPILDIRQQVAARFGGAAAEARVRSGPAVFLSRVSVVLFGKGLEVDSLSIVPAGDMALHIRAADFAAVDRLVLEMRGAGLAARVASSRARPGRGVEAQIAVSKPGDGSP